MQEKKQQAGIKIEKERFINLNTDKGLCPFCNSDNYKRTNLEPSDDIIFANCECLNCEKKFKETFKLEYQNWEE